MEGTKNLQNYFNSQLQNQLGSSNFQLGFSKAQFTIVEKETEKVVKPRKQYNKNIPEVIKKEVCQYSVVHGTKAVSVLKKSIQSIPV